MARLRARGWVATVGLAVLAGGCAAPVSGQSRPEAVRPVTAAAPAAVPPPPAPRAPVAAAPVLRAPSPDPASRLWPFKRLFDRDYVDVRAVAERFGLRAEWLVSGRVMRLADGQGHNRLKFEEHDRDCYIDNLRVFLGDAVVYYRGTLYVSKIDVIKTLVPLLSPEEQAGHLPPPPRLIVLDPGHGGNDDGATNKRLKLVEKELTLDTAMRLEKLLVARGYRVILTRTADRYVALDRRDEIADAAHADLFVSLHFNSATPGVSGVETWVMTPQFQTSTEVEQDKSMIPAAYPGNRQDIANVVLGFAVHRRVLADLGTSDRGLKRRRLAVLRFLNCPGVLVESAYLSNEIEARRVATPEYRQRIAAAIAKGIEDYVAILASSHPGAPGAASARPLSPP
jgi:N-acetylmuramoyl-L-alanine amidase